MKQYLGIVLLFLCIAVICVAGCLNQPEAPDIIPAPTPTLSLPATVSKPIIVTPKIPKTTPLVTTRTPAPKTDATEVSKITFVRYSDGDFSVDYPSTWKIVKSTYTPYYCQNNLNTESSVYQICYKNETRLMGPFNYYDDSNLKKQRRIVTFTSTDGKLKFVSYTSDFFDNLNGNVMINPTLEWSRAQFENNYPDLTGYASKYMGSYNFLSSGNSMISTYDVTMPKGAKYYPSAYTKKSVV